MKPWLVEVMTEDGLAFHCSRHHGLEEAEIRRDEVLAAWRKLGWGQDPALDHVSAKAIHSCVTRTRPTPVMTREDMLRWGEQIATIIIEKNLTDEDRARLAMVVGCQLTLMAQVFAEDEGIDSAALFRESMDRATRWHEGILATIASTGAAS